MTPKKRKTQVLSIVLVALTTVILAPDNSLSTWFHWIRDFLGTAFSWFLVAFLYACLIHSAFVERVSPKTRPEDMPILRPIPIPTKSRCWFVKPFVWLIEPRRWRLVKDWCYTLNTGQNSTTIIVPRGFEFDGASIPRFLWFFLSPTGLLLIPGLIHDYGYKYDQLWKLDAAGAIVPFKPRAGRPYWDNLLYKVGRQVNDLSPLDGLAWVFVVCFACFTWRRHRRRNCRDTAPTTAGRCAPAQPPRTDPSNLTQSIPPKPSEDQ